MENKDNLNLNNQLKNDGIIKNQNDESKLDETLSNSIDDHLERENNIKNSNDLQNNSTPFVETPARVLASMYFSRFAIILSNLSLVCVILSFASAITVMISWLVWVVGMMLILVTLGIILLVVPGYWDGLVNSGEVLGNVSDFLIKYWPYVASIGVVSAIASIVLLSCDKTKNHTARIIFSSIVLALILVAVVVMIVQGGKA